jgi:hypothetical protein
LLYLDVLIVEVLLKKFWLLALAGILPASHV